MYFIVIVILQLILFHLVGKAKLSFKFESRFYFIFIILYNFILLF